MKNTEMLDRVTDKQAALAGRFLYMMHEEKFHVDEARKTLEYARALMEDEINQKQL